MSEALCAAWRPAPSGEGAADLALVELEGSMASEGSNGKVNGSTRRVRRPPASCKRLEGIERFPNLLFTMLGFFQPLDSQSMEANQGAFCSIPCDIIYKGGEQQFQDLELKKARMEDGGQRDWSMVAAGYRWGPCGVVLQGLVACRGLGVVGRRAAGWSSGARLCWWRGGWLSSGGWRGASWRPASGGSLLRWCPRRPALTLSVPESPALEVAHGITARRGEVVWGEAPEAAALSLAFEGEQRLGWGPP
ncbi:uncharacterized protein LOC101785971 isoform X2 [Setaria italica]|uniref:uncharacterized protein LOC101785971 isoform X2 n=1 Tax=Setaria italica TaxID=4555 RepID=UPI000BE52687|nr:uncharacterized protein LOC101785971 isoform X2 [Setaria italica]